MSASAVAETEVEPVRPYQAGPSFGAAMARVRQWAHGLPERRVCEQHVCPAIDRFDAAMLEGDLDSANRLLTPLRAAVSQHVSGRCDRAAGLSAINQLECEANPELPGRDPIYCVFRSDDLAPRIPAPVIRECSDDLCNSRPLMRRMRGSFRWAVCKANNLAPEGGRPRIHFALELESCEGDRPRFEPIRLERVATHLYRDGTVIDGYTLPGATRGDLRVPRAPQGLPVVSGAKLPRAGESITPSLAIIASDTTIRGIEFRDNVGEAPLVLRPEGAKKGDCPFAAKRNWIAGNLFEDNDRFSIFVEIPLPRGGRGPGAFDVRANVIGVRADRPDPGDGNVFRGRGQLRVVLASGIDPEKKLHFGITRDNEIRGNWFQHAPTGDLPRAIWLNGTEDDLIECNRFTDLAGGIFIDSSFGIEVVANRFSRVALPVRLAQGSAAYRIGRLEAPDSLRGLGCVPEELGGGNLIIGARHGVELVGEVGPGRIEGNDVRSRGQAVVTVPGWTAGTLAP